jgi:hypothetical protein
MTSLDTLLAWAGWPLIDTTQGDAPQMVQMVDSILAAPTEHVGAATMVFQPTGPLTILNGAGTQPVYGEFAYLPQTTTVQANYSRSQFAAYRSSYNLNRTLGWGPFIEFDSEPGAAAYGNTGQWLDGLYVQNSDSTVTTDLNQGPLAAPALAPGVERIAYAGETYYLKAQLPGTTAATQFAVKAMRSYTLAQPDASHPIKPLVSPVQNPTINGLSLFADRTGVTTTPTLAWTAPSLGTPQGYKIVVYQLSGGAGVPTTASVAHNVYLDGTQTSLTLPSGILVAGTTYCFKIVAYSDSTYDPTAAPYAANRFPYGLSESLSNLVTP